MFESEAILVGPSKASLVFKLRMHLVMVFICFVVVPLVELLYVNDFCDNIFVLITLQFGIFTVKNQVLKPAQ